MSQATPTPVFNEEELAAGHELLSHVRAVIREVVAMAVAYSIASGFWFTLIVYAAMSLLMYFVDRYVGERVQARVPDAAAAAIGKRFIKTKGFALGLFTRKEAAPVAA